MPKLLKAHLALLAVALIYGANYTIAKVVMDDGHLHPLAFILLRVSAAGTLFWFFHTTFVREKVRWADRWQLVLCAIFGVALNQMFFFSGLRLTSPIHASLIMTTTPLLVLFISSLINKERITGRKLTGIALGAGGAILLIVYGKEVSFGATQWLGDIMVFINAASYGVYLVLVRRLMARYHPITVVKWVFTLGFFMVLPFGWSGLSEAAWGSFTLPIWLAIGYVLLLTTFTAYLFNAYALSFVPASVAGMYIYLQPLFATLISLAAGQEHLGVLKIASALLIFSGVYLAGTGAKQVVAEENA